MSDLTQILLAPTPPKGKLPAVRTQETMLDQMRRLRALDEAMLARAQAGRLPYFLSQKGWEAVTVGLATALKAGDWLYPGTVVPGTHGPDVRCSVEGLRIVPAASPSGARLVHAHGTAWATKLAGGREVTCVTFGESAANQDHFHVAANFAGVYDSPLLMIAMVDGDHVDTAGENIAARADAYGIAGVRVHGSDILAIHKVVSAAARKARTGKGATLIEVVRPPGAPDPIRVLQEHLGSPDSSGDETRERVEEDLKNAISLCSDQDIRSQVFASTS